MTDDLVPGEVRAGDGTIMLNEDRETTTVTVRNTGDRPVQIGSHFHFFEVNAALEFDRKTAYGMRLDVPAGTAVRFEPGDATTVDLVAIGGKRRVSGMNGLVNGSVEEGADEATAQAEAAGFATTSDQGDAGHEQEGEE